MWGKNKQLIEASILGTTRLFHSLISFLNGVKRVFDTHRVRKYSFFVPSQQVRECLGKNRSLGN